MRKIGNIANGAWRIVATGLCFVVFGLGELVLLYGAIPMINLISGSSSKKHLRTQHAISILFKGFVILTQFFGLILYEFKNIEKIMQSRGCLIISNHPTLIDIVVIISKLKHCQIIIKQALFNKWFMKKILRNAGYVENKQSIETFDRIKKLLNQGNKFFIFPEGTRSIPGQPLTLQRGAANLAIRAGAPILILHIKSSPSSLDKHGKWYKIPKKKIQYSVEVGARIDPGDFLKDNVAPSIAARRLTRRLKFELEKGLNA